MAFIYDDGGRSKFFAKRPPKSGGDCVTRAITIATGMRYIDVWKDLDYLCMKSPLRMRNGHRHNPDMGIPKAIWEPYLLDLGWKWIPTMSRGTGTYVHVNPSELPLVAAPLILRNSRHLSVMDQNGNEHGIHDCSRNGTRAVYGVYVKHIYHAIASSWLQNLRIAKIGR